MWSKNKQHLTFDRRNFKPRGKKQKQETKGQISSFLYKNVLVWRRCLFLKRSQENSWKKKKKQNSKPPGNNNRYEDEGGARFKKKIVSVNLRPKKSRQKIFLLMKLWSLFSQKKIYLKSPNQSKNGERYILETHIIFLRHNVIKRFCVRIRGVFRFSKMFLV